MVGWCLISYEIDDYTIFGGTKVQHIWGDFFFQCLWDWRKSSCLRLLFEVYIPVFGQSWIDLYRLNEIEHRVLLFNHIPCSEVLTANHLSSNWSIRFCPDCLSIFQGAASLSTKMNSQHLSTANHILWQYEKHPLACLLWEIGWFSPSKQIHPCFVQRLEG